MPSTAVLQRQRMGLMRRHQAHRAAIEKHLAALVKAYKAAEEITGKIAIVDLALNEQFDTRVQRVLDAHDDTVVLRAQYADES